MKVRVRSIGTMRQVLGAAELEVTVPEGTTLRELVLHLKKEKGKGFAPYATEPETPTSYAPLRILVNGRDVPPGRHPDTVLDEADDVLMFAPIAGG